MNKRQQRAMKIAAQQALVNGAAGRELTAEESAQFDTLQREIDALTLEIEAEERQQSRRQPDSRQRVPQQLQEQRARETWAARRMQRPGQWQQSAREYRTFPTFAASLT